MKKTYDDYYEHPVTVWFLLIWAIIMYPVYFIWYLPMEIITVIGCIIEPDSKAMYICYHKVNLFVSTFINIVTFSIGCVFHLIAVVITGSKFTIFDEIGLVTIGLCAIIIPIIMYQIKRQDDEDTRPVKKVEWK